MNSRIIKFRAWNQKYEIGDDGSVWSLDYNHTGKRRQMRTYLDDDGYPHVFLTQSGKRTKLMVHKAVAALFLPPQPSPTHQVNHKDRNRQNADAHNLEWLTPRENVIHSWANGRVVSRATREKMGIRWRGEGNPKATKTVAEIRAIRARRDAGESLKTLALEFQLSTSQISAIGTRRSWKETSNVYENSDIIPT